MSHTTMTRRFLRLVEAFGSGGYLQRFHDQRDEVGVSSVVRDERLAIIDDL